MTECRSYSLCKQLRTLTLYSKILKQLLVRTVWTERQGVYSYWYSFLWWSCLVQPTMDSTSNYSALLLFSSNYFSRNFVLISARLIHGMHSSPCTPSPPLTHSLLTLMHPSIPHRSCRCTNGGNGSHAWRVC